MFSFFNFATCLIRYMHVRMMRCRVQVVSWVSNVQVVSWVCNMSGWCGVTGVQVVSWVCKRTCCRLLCPLSLRFSVCRRLTRLSSASWSADGAVWCDQLMASAASNAHDTNNNTLLDNVRRSFVNWLTCLSDLSFACCEKVFVVSQWGMSIDVTCFYWRISQWEQHWQMCLWEYWIQCSCCCLMKTVDTESLSICLLARATRVLAASSCCCNTVALPSFSCGTFTTVITTSACSK